MGARAAAAAASAPGRIVSERQLAIMLGGLVGTPRIVADGNFG
jgi:ABC-type tungstate transport system substrate-binding protein